MITYHVRPATESDLDACFELRRQTEQMFRHAGLDQWHDSNEGQRVIRKWVGRGSMNVVTTHAGDVVACFALDTADQDFWTADEAAEDAIYLYKVMIRPDRRGSGLGEAILDYAAHRGAGDRCARWLRVDCWKTNTGLHRYFTDRGFEHLDTRTAPGRNSGWLAQRPIHVRCNDGRVELTEEPPVAVLGGDRYDDPVSSALRQVADEIAAMKTDLAATGSEIGGVAALEQASRHVEVRAREQRQRNGMAHRPYTGAQA